MSLVPPAFARCPLPLVPPGKPPIPSLKVVNLRNIWTLIKILGVKCIELKVSCLLCVVKSLKTLKSPLDGKEIKPVNPKGKLYPT